MGAEIQYTNVALKEVSTLTIGEEITATIRETLESAKRSGQPIVPCATMWNRVGNKRSLGDPMYGRYKSVLRELIQTSKIKMHKDDEGRPTGFELLERKH